MTAQVKGLLQEIADDQPIWSLSSKKVAVRTPILELNAAKPLSDLRDITSGNVSDASGEYRVQHITSGDFSSLVSTSRGEYQPGNQIEVGIGARLDDTGLSGDANIRWGYFDTQVGDNQKINNGIMFGLDNSGSGMFVEIINQGSTLHKRYQDKFNIAQPSNFDLQEGNIFEISLVYYGYGLIKWSYLPVNDGDTNHQQYDLHSLKIENQVSFPSPNLSVGAIAESTDSPNNFSIYVGGRKVDTIGPFSPRRRVNSGRVESVSVEGNSDFIPLLSFRRKNDFRQIASDVFGYDIISDKDGILQIRINSTLDGASFGNLNEQPSGETSLELDASASGINTGTGVKVYETLVFGGAKNKDDSLTTQKGILTDVPDEGTITFSYKNLESQTATVHFVGQLEERY